MRFTRLIWKCVMMPDHNEPVRHCFREPIPEIFDAAVLLAAVGTVHREGDQLLGAGDVTE